MSSLSTKVKVNLQEKTFEIEGSEEFVREMTEKIQQLIEGTPVSEPEKEPTKKQDKDEKTDKRGGTRSSVISPAIDKLIEDGWFSDFKPIDEVVTELQRLNIPGVEYEVGVVKT